MKLFKQEHNINHFKLKNCYKKILYIKTFNSKIKKSLNEIFIKHFHFQLMQQMKQKLHMQFS